MKRIATAEVLKRDNIPEETVKAWFAVCQQMNWSERDLDNKFAAIMKRKSFGNDTIRIDDFFADEKTYTYSEVVNIVNRQIERRIKRGENLLRFNTLKDPREFFMEFFDIKDVDIKLAVENALKYEYEYEKGRLMEELIEQKKNEAWEKVKTFRRKLVKLPKWHKLALINLLAEKGKLQLKNEADAEFWASEIQIFAIDLSEEDIKLTKEVKCE